MYRVFAIVIGVCTSAVSSAQTTLLNPGTLGGNFALAGGVSADGSTVVGTATNLAGQPRAFRWTISSGQMQDLGDLGGLTSYGVAVNSNGTVVACDGSFDPQGGPSRPYRWSTSMPIIEVGTLGGDSGQSLAISQDGNSIVGTSGIPDASYGSAFRWTSTGGIENLGNWGGIGAAAFAVNHNGSIIAGTRSNVALISEAIRWSSGTGPIAIGSLGSGWSEAADIDASGNAVVGSSFSDQNLESAYLWTANTGMQNLAALPAFESRATSITGNGRVVGGTKNSGDAPSVWTAFVWSCRGGMQDLRSLVQSRGVNVSGWVFTRVDGFSADGSTIVGSGTFNGDRRVFVIRMPPLHCTADFNCSGTISVQDLFDFLRAWFSLGYGADVNGMSGISVQDIFDFLAAWFQGC